MTQDALGDQSTGSILASVFKADTHMLVGVFQGHPALLLYSVSLHLDREKNFLKSRSVPITDDFMSGQSHFASFLQASGIEIEC